MPMRTRAASRAAAGARAGAQPAGRAAEAVPPAEEAAAPVARGTGEDGAGGAGRVLAKQGRVQRGASAHI